MSREQERSRLIQLIGEIRAYEHGGMATVTDEGIADYLLDNGVIAPPVKIGDTVWFTPMYEGKPLGMVREDKVQVIGVSSRGFQLKLRNHQDHNKTYYLGKTVFLTKEEAEKALCGGLTGKEIDMSATRYINAFRAKSATDGRWMYGDLFRGTHISHPRGATTIKPETVGMYTGFIDKHGASVFEHDICRYTAIRTTVVGTVVWERGCFWLRVDDERKEPFYKVATIGEFEVIGNIYDNPELIGGDA